MWDLGDLGGEEEDVFGAGASAGEGPQVDDASRGGGGAADSTGAGAATPQQKRGLKRRTSSLAGSMVPGPSFLVQLA